ncbi:MAG: DNA repair protein RecO [Massilibacteroides sp.]|nr:DNA repair protein RecO [Massilibacteroides sp.]MDD3062639.1 DNA repair protein RecO [Massilibacteroides sp.]MDD4116032.1 DNA repair protein RecO [Massilibacteroides sp.]MDD4659532.1 DNA repair protein RecO [Massilibacteroides sp.]
MLAKTKGVVLHTIPYSDTYSIVHVYTETFGRAAYLVPRNKGKKATFAKALFIPLSVVEMEVDHQNKRDLHRIKEIRISFPQTEIYCNPVKNIIAMFLAEVLFRVLKETEPDVSLFQYLYDSIQLMEVVEDGIANFHIVFLLKLLIHLGIYPNTESGANREYGYFDLLNGVFVQTIPLHRHFLGKEESAVFGRLLRISFENMSLYSFSRRERVAIIGHILEYYRLHLPEFPEIKSISVMQSLFD